MDLHELIMLSEVRRVRGAKLSPFRAPDDDFARVTLSVRAASCPRAPRCTHQAWTRQVLQARLRLSQGLRALRGRMSRGKAKRPPIECVNAVEPSSGRAGRYFVFIIRALSPTGALSRAIFVSDFPDLCYSCSWFPKKAASAAGSEAGMDCATALAKRACGEALRWRVFARPRAPALAAEGNCQAGLGRMLQRTKAALSSRVAIGRRETPVFQTGFGGVAIQENLRRARRSPDRFAYARDDGAR